MASTFACKDIGIASNELWFNSSTKSSALVCKKDDQHPGYLINKAGLDHLNLAVKGDRLSQAYVVLPDYEEIRRVVVKEMTIAAVIDVLQGITPRDGPYGLYFWLNQDGTPHGKQEALPY